MNAVANTVCAIAVVVFVAACAPTTADTLRDDPGVSASYRAPDPLPQAYESVTNGFLRCLTGDYFRMTFFAKSRIDADGRHASVTLVHHGAWKDIWAVVDISTEGPEGEEATLIHTYTTSSPLMQQFGPTVDDWARGGNGCPPYSPVLRHVPYTE